MLILIRRLRIFILILITLLPAAGLNGCRASYYKVPIVKSRKHFRPYDRKRDHHKKRVKVKKYKSLKSTKALKKKEDD